ncbi:MAG: heavy-metal-associated domain-containing protein [Methylococcaceae bacterium]|nr:heavy-metal-associated domain-containing protein [Methylococcaceae bacterium]
MKTLQKILSMVFFLLILSVSYANEAVYSLQVDGLGCPFCAYGIEKQLSVIEGVDSVVVDISKGLVNVTMQQDAYLDKERARQAVTDAGFTLQSFRGKIDESDETVQ